MARLIIQLCEDDMKALRILAEKELRDPRSQALLLIRQSLQKSGILNLQNIPKGKNLIGDKL